MAEAFSWFGTSVSIGIAGGSVAGGWLIDGHGWQAAVVLGVACVAVGAVVTALRRGTLAPPLVGAGLEARIESDSEALGESARTPFVRSPTTLVMSGLWIRENAGSTFLLDPNHQSTRLAPYFFFASQ